MIDMLGADGTPVDFVFCAGDDSTDEFMFAMLNSKLGKTDPQLFTVTVGRKPSEASRYLDSYTDIVQLLELFCTIGFRTPGATLGARGGLGGMKKSTASIGGMGQQGVVQQLAELPSNGGGSGVDDMGASRRSRRWHAESRQVRGSVYHVRRGAGGRSCGGMRGG